MIRRMFARLVIVALIGLCGYKEWQVRQLQAEVGRLTASQARTAKVAVKNAQNAPNGWLEQAEAHADRAKNALARGDFGTAQRELAQANAATQEPQRRTRAAVTDARRRFAALQADLQKLQAQAKSLSEKMSQGNTP